MENRFGIKDLITVTLLVLVLVSVWLAMKQYDRQFDVVKSVNEKIGQQTRDLSEIRRMLERGGGVTTVIPATAPASDGGTAAPDPFARIKAARAMPGFSEGDWCIDAFGANVAKITPLVTVDAYGGTIQGLVLESLAMRDPNTLEWLPLLAESWKIDDNEKAWQAYVDRRIVVPLTRGEVEGEADCPKPDVADKRSKYITDRLKEGRRISDIVHEKDCPAATVITFKLRRGVVYSDGFPLTARDFVFTFNLINNPKIDASRDRQGIVNVRSITANGDYDVVFTYNEPYFESFGLAAGFSPLAEHFYGKYPPEEFNKTPGLLLGTGPYQMESPIDWTPGKLLQLIRNPRYWGTAPAFDRIIYREVNNDVARMTMFRNREIDFFAAMPEQYVELRKDPAITARANSYEFERITSGYGFVAWNEKRGGKPTPFADKRVRLAMTMMINRQRLLDEILLGFAIPATGPFNRLSPQSDPSVQPWPYDVQKAMAILKEAGFFDRDGDGTIDAPDGKPFRFKLLFPSGTSFWERVSLMLKDSFAKAGIVMELEPLEWSVFDERVKARDYDALCMAWGGGIETDIRQMFHSSQIADRADNFISYVNPELDKLIDQARRTVDESKRMPLWKRCQQLLHEDQPYTFLYSRKSLIFLDNRIQNVQRVKLGINDRDEWFVPRAQQMRKD
ncbi:MAG: ABC transporter substrate-binding protein [Planctomycetes bacterium]|nr:ABC transporter substrate-binding protein [Planctomycetota bacterium]